MSKQAVSLEAFQKDLSSNNWEELSFCGIAAASAYEKEEAESFFKRKFLASYKSGQILEVAANKTEDFLAAVQTLSFLEEKTLLVVSNMEGAKKNHLQEISSYLKNPSPGFIHLFIGEKLPKEIESLCLSSGVLLMPPVLKPWEKTDHLVAFASAFMKKEKKVLPQDLAKEICEASGGDKRIIASELEKLSLYLGDQKEVKRQDIEAVCILPNPPSAWGLGVKLAAGKKGEVLSLVNRLLNDGTPFAQLIRLLRSQVQTLFRLGAMAEGGASLQALQNEFPFFRGKSLQEAVAVAQRAGKPFFVKSLLAIDQAEVAFKNSSLGHEHLVELLIFSK